MLQIAPSRRLTTIFVIILIIALLLPAAAMSAGLSEKKRQLAASERKAAELQRKLNRVAGRYQDAHHDYVDTKFDVRKTQKKIRITQSQIKARQALLSDRADFMYRHGNVSLADVLLGAEDFNELVTRFDFLMRIASFDNDLIGDIRADQASLQKDKAVLNKRLARQRALVDSLEDANAELEALFRKQEKQSKQIAGDLKRTQALQASLASQGYSSRDIAVQVKFKRGGYTFPVAGPRAYASTYGAPRRGHRHQGNDIFGRRGTPLVAVTSGSVRKRNGGIGGLAVWLSGTDGNCYYYAHLDGFGASGRVSAGTVIGYLGDTGNAKGTSPHVHFEIHPGCGRSTDPYSILRSWE